MFTRNLYELDEVLAALRWSMRQGRTQEALFWCFELVESECEEQLKEELYKSWLWLFGIGCLSGVELLQQETYYEIVYALTRLPKEKRDRSVLILLLLGSQDTKLPDRVNTIQKCQSFLFQENYTDLEKAFIFAVYQGKSRLAFDLSRPLWQENSTRVYTLLQSLQTFKHNSSRLSEILTLLEIQEKECWATRACAIASVCLDKKRLSDSLKPLSHDLPQAMKECLEEWKQMLGRRKGRVYEIPRECLYKLTKRGRMSNKETNLQTLYTINESTLEGCPFWNRVLEEEVPWLDDERKEAFFDAYFPDDIPDEWSKQDQEKSHGLGSLINQETPNAKKYIDRWYRDFPTRAYWCTNRDMQRFIHEKDLDSLLNQSWIESVSTWCLTPVKKRILVVDSDT